MENFKTMDIAIVAFFVISLCVLIINVYTIRSLRKERLESNENQVLLSQLLQQIQGYFGKIDQSIVSLSQQEKSLQNSIQTNKEEETTILETLSENQTVFVDRMDKIIDIQLSLSKRINEQSVIKPSQPSKEETTDKSSLEQRLEQFIVWQKHEIAVIKKQLEVLSILSNKVDGLNIHFEKGFESSLQMLELAVNNHISAISSHFGVLKNELSNETSTLQKSIEMIQNSNQDIEVLNKNVQLAQRNIAQTIEQSIDLSPIYKSIHEMIGTTHSMFAEYETAKGDISTLIHTFQAHEQQNLVALNDEVKMFLATMNIELKESVNLLQHKIEQSVELLQKDFHSTQNKVSATVNTLSERNRLNQAYQTDEES